MSLRPAAVLLGVLLATPGLAIRIGDVEVLPDPTSGPALGHGYVEYRVLVRNLSAEQSRRVTLTIPGRLWRTGSGLERVSRSVDVGPRSTRRISLFQPHIPLYGDGMHIAVAGGGEDRIPLTLPSEFWPTVYDGTRAVALRRMLVSPSVPIDDLQSAAEAGRSSPSRSGSPSAVIALPPARLSPFRFERSTLPIEDWPESWLSYSSYDGIFVSGGDATRMSPAALAALLDYTEAGGTLTVLGDFDQSPSWVPADEGLPGLRSYFAGFGRAFCVFAMTQDAWRPIERAVTQTASLAASPDPTSVNRAFPVVEEARTPIRGLFLVMLGFVILAGPVNLYLSRRWKRRMLLLWAVPVLSLVASAAVASFALFSEGMHRRARTEVITFLDQASRRATTIGLTAFYSTLTPVDGLFFGPATELQPLGPGGQGGLRVDWTDGQHFEAGWVKARIPVHFRARKSESRRERVRVSRQGDGLEATHGLGVPIRELYVADERGLWRAPSAIPAGARSILAREPSAGGSRRDDALRDLFSSDWSGLVNRLHAQPQSYLRPGCYIAFLDASPFFEEGLRKTRDRKTSSAVFGIWSRDES